MAESPNCAKMESFLRFWTGEYEIYVLSNVFAGFGYRGEHFKDREYFKDR